MLKILRIFSKQEPVKKAGEGTFEVRYSTGGGATEYFVSIFCKTLDDAIDVFITKVKNGSRWVELNKITNAGEEQLFLHNSTVSAHTVRRIRS